MESQLEIISLNAENIDSEHICCAIADKKTENGVKCKKQWLKYRFAEGYVFKKFNVRGKVFIEYGLAENAWSPIEAPNYLFVHCFWVSGSYAGKGLASKLLEACFSDAEAQKKDGVVILSSKTKMPFLSDKKYLLKKGFEVCDTATPYFELLVKKLNTKAVSPQFKEVLKQPKVENKNGLLIYYSEQCPFTDFYIKDVESAAKEMNIPFQSIKIETKAQAQNVPTPFTTYTVFNNGKFLTHEILNKNRLEKFLNKVN